MQGTHLLYHAPFFERKKKIKVAIRDRETYVKPGAVRGNDGITVLFRPGMCSVM
jgi:hypothetical protein